MRRFSWNIYAPTFIYPSWMFLVFCFSSQWFFLFLWLSPAVVYAILMNRFSARILTESEWFNFPYFFGVGCQMVFERSCKIWRRSNIEKHKDPVGKKLTERVTEDHEYEFAISLILSVHVSNPLLYVCTKSAYKLQFFWQIDGRFYSLLLFTSMLVDLFLKTYELHVFWLSSGGLWRTILNFNRPALTKNYSRWWSKPN